jgi:hypothetical protein
MSIISNSGLLGIGIVASGLFAILFFRTSGARATGISSTSIIASLGLCVMAVSASVGIAQRQIAATQGSESAAARSSSTSEPYVVAFDVPRTYHAFYRDADDAKSGNVTEPKIETEDYKLQFSKISEVARGSLEASNEKAWDVFGFIRDKDFALSFGSKPTNKKSGVGAIYLSKSSDTDFIGNALFKDCENHRVFRCPYAITSNDISVSEAKLRWSDLFSSQCETIEMSSQAVC